MRRFLPGLCLGLALLASCRKNSGSPPDAAAKPGMNPAADTSAGPGAALPKHAWLYARFPCGKDSAVALYDDTADNDDEIVRHKRIDSLPSEYGYFVERTFTEGGDWLFISKRDCAQKSLFGEARFNPSRTRFAAVNESLDAAFSANGVQIVSLESGMPKMEFADSMDVWGPQSWAWADDSTLVVELMGTQGQRQRRVYGLRAGAWAFHDETMRSRPVDSLPFPEVEDESPPGD